MKPIINFKDRGIDVAIWEGQNSRSVSIRKTYKDKTTGEWKESKFLFDNEIPILLRLLKDCDEFLKVKPKTYPSGTDASKIGYTQNKETYQTLDEIPF